MSNERVVCAECGSNNFATQAACWKCGKTLAATPTPSGTAILTAAPSAVRYVGSTDSAKESPAALWSSVALGVIFPVISIPVGLVFLMLDDKRKAQIGWWNILFGLVGTVLNGIVIAVSLIAPLKALTASLPGMGGLGGRSGMSSQDPNSEVPPLNLPGQPRFFANPPR